MSRELTTDEARDQLVAHVRDMIAYWEAQPGSSRSQLEGLAFSILVILDGETMLPGFKVACCAEHGENWFPDGVDLAGSLHERLFTKVQR